MQESRRQFFKKNIPVGLATVFGGAGYLEFQKEISDRTKEVLEKSKILKNETNGVFKIGAKEYSLEDLKDVLPKIVSLSGSSRKQTDIYLTHEEAGEMLHTLGTVIELEDSFGRKINTLPALENVDQFLEEKTGKILPLANSFGLGQINPLTAREIVLRYGDKLVSEGLLTEENFQKIKKDKIKQYEIVQLLDLRGDTNLVYSFLTLYEAYDYYARDTKGKLHSNIDQDPRATNLAIAAYSARQCSPLGAKFQTKLNEITLFYGDPGAKLDFLIPDGDAGVKTMQVLDKILHREGLFVEPQILEEANKGNIVAIEYLLRIINPIWQKTGKNVIEVASTEDMAKLYSGRYMAVNNCYLLLRKEFAKTDKEKAKLKKYFDDFIDHRSTVMFDLIDNRTLFELVFKNASYEHFIATLRAQWPEIVSFEERYKGYIPLGFKPPKQLGEDPKNVMLRIIEHLDLAKPNSQVK